MGLILAYTCLAEVVENDILLSPTLTLLPSFAYIFVHIYLCRPLEWCTGIPIINLIFPRKTPIIGKHSINFETLDNFVAR